MPVSQAQQTIHGAASTFPAGTVCAGCCTQLVDFGVRLGGTQVLQHINLHVHCGELTAIIGPNGAGKTTLLRAMLGEIPHTGELRFAPAGAGRTVLVPRVGYVPQRLDFDPASPVSVTDLFAAASASLPVWLGSRAMTRRLARAALDRVGVADLAEARLGHLSCGQLQRVLLALALEPLPDLLLLDEPVSGVDQAGTAVFYEIVGNLRHQFDLSVILISHDLAEVAQHADRLVFLQRTVLADGPPAQVLADPTVRRTFNLDIVLPAAASA
jgi:zinc transport system ATP-binding protein